VRLLYFDSFQGCCPGNTSPEEKRVWK